MTGVNHLDILKRGVTEWNIRNIIADAFGVRQMEKLLGFVNIGSGIGTSINMIFSALAKLADYGEEAVHGPAKAGEVDKIFLNSDRAKEILDWKPNVGLMEGLKATVDFFRQSSRI